MNLWYLCHFLNLVSVSLTHALRNVVWTWLLLETQMMRKEKTEDRQNVKCVPSNLKPA